MLTRIVKSLKVLGQSNKAQSLAEYAILLGVIIAAVLAMQPFIRRRTQAILFDSASEFGNVEFSADYDPMLGKQETSGYTSTGRSFVDNLSAGANQEHLVGSETNNRTGSVSRNEVF